MPIISYRALQRYISREHIVPNVFCREMEFTARSNDCRVCYRTVTARQHALECDRCKLWTHRLCGTGIYIYRIRSRPTAELWRPLDAVPPPSHLERYANYHRQKTRPTDPTSLCFVLNTQYIPDDFVKADVTVGNQRHLVFATTFLC